jgi:hypothetical protein
VAIEIAKTAAARKHFLGIAVPSTSIGVASWESADRRLKSCPSWL